MPTRIVRTTIPIDSVFHFQAIVRSEGNNGLRVAIPAHIVRGLVHLKWQGRWLNVKLIDKTFIVAVRPHPTSVMFAIPKMHRENMKPGSNIELEISAATGPKARATKRVRGITRTANQPLSLRWLGAHE